MKRHVLIAVLLLFVSCTLAAAAGSTTLFNDTGVEVYGLRVVFDQPVTIVRMGDVLGSWTSEEDDTIVVFAEGSIAVWGDFYFFWEPAEACVVSYEWLADPPSAVHSLSAEHSPSVSADSELVSARLGSEAYRGAIVVLEYAGPSSNLEEGNNRVDFYQAGDYVHSAVPVVLAPTILEVEIIDAMFETGTPIRGELHLMNEQAPISFTLSFDRFFPWLDWMLAPGDEKSLRDWFRYNWPSCGNGLGAHSSWDFGTRGSATVYSGTNGQVFMLSDKAGRENVYVYNPHTGFILQYGHVHPLGSLREDMSIRAGDPIGRVDTRHSEWAHIHFSVIRPLGWYASGEPYWWERDRTRNVFDSFYYKNPAYFHEPTTWGYWNVETLPEGWNALMKKYFRRHNPGITSAINKRHIGNKTTDQPPASVPRDFGALASKVYNIADSFRDGEIGPEWDSPLLVVRDGTGETDLPEADLTALIVQADEEFLYLRLDLSAQPSGMVRYSVNILPIGSSESSHSIHSGGEGLHGPDGWICHVDFALGEVVELAVPRTAYGDLGAFLISADTRAFGTGWSDRYDDIARTRITMP